MAERQEQVEKLKSQALEIACGKNLLETIEILTRAKAHRQNVYVVFAGVKLYSFFDDEYSCNEKVDAEIKRQSLNDIINSD